MMAGHNRHTCGHCRELQAEPCIACGAPILNGIGHDPGCMVAPDVEYAARRYEIARLALSNAQSEYDDADMRLRAAYATRDLSPSPDILR